MNKLEKKIVQKVYKLEARRTILEIIIRILLIVLFGFLGGVFLFQLVNQYRIQQTFDLLEIFNEDIEIIKEFFADVIDTFYQETPKETFVLVLIFIILLFIALLTFTRNYGKIKNRMRALMKFWARKKV